MNRQFASLPAIQTFWHRLEFPSPRLPMKQYQIYLKIESCTQLLPHVLYYPLDEIIMMTFLEVLSGEFAP